MGMGINPTNKPDKGITLWNLVRKYVKKNHPKVPLDSENAVAGCYRFRIKVSKNEVEITDAGVSAGEKDPGYFSRETIRAADPDLFKRISAVCKHRGRGGVCVYREQITSGGGGGGGGGGLIVILAQAGGCTITANGGTGGEGKIVPVKKGKK